MKNGDVYCWGRNEKGELGDGTLASKSVPTKVKLTSPAVQVDGGASATMSTYTPKTCAAMVNGEVWCWGNGNGTPAKVMGLSNVKQVSVGDTHTCALTMTGTLYCWGTNVYGQIGNGTNTYVATPTQIGMSMAFVTAGGHHTCARATGGVLKCWGLNSSGQLGIGNQSNQNLPSTVAGVADVIDVTAGAAHTCAIAAGVVYCWGANQSGQLGTGGIMELSAPTIAVQQEGSKVIAGFSFSGAIASDSVLMWGFNGNGQLGNGMTATVYTPSAIGITNASTLACGAASACTLLTSGEIRCWGANTYGQLGSGGNVQELSPVRVIWP
jgi:alpha-tubulin suppressor-like RCC1 family protein